MKKLIGALLIATIALAILIPTALAQTDYYVDVGAGNDGNTGLIGNPWKTITHAANTVPAGAPGIPNTINVAAGTYSGSETFAITFANDYVECVGAGPATTIIDGAGANPIIEIQATGIRIQDFTIQNGGTAIFVSEGGFAIAGNTFSGSPAFDIVKAISWIMDEESTSDRTIEDTLIDGNTFNVSCDGIYMYVYLDRDDSSANVTIGDIDIINNVYQAGPGPTPDTREGIEVDDLVVEYLNGGILSVGTFNISNNEFNDGQHAIVFDGEFDLMTDATVTVGNVIVNGNTLLNQTNSSAMYIDYYDCDYWYGTSTGILGDLIITDNTVISPGPSWGIDVDDIGYWTEFYDTANLTVGDIIIQGNTVDVDGVGISVSMDSYSYLYDDSQVTTGDLIISSGTVVAGEEGIYVYLYDVGYEMYGNAKCTIGDMYIENNSIDAQEEGIYFYYEDVAYYMYDDSSLYMGDWFIRDNPQILSDDYGIYIEYYDYYVGGYNYNNAYGELPSYNITGNTFDTSSDGIYFHTYSNPDDTYGSSKVDYGGFFIDSNIFNSGTYTMYNGIYMYYEDFCEGCYDSSGAIVQDITITNNQFTDLSGDAINFYLNEIGYAYDDNGFVNFGDINISGNTVDGADNGVYMDYDEISADYNGRTTMGKLDIVGNEFSNISADGVYLDYNLQAYDTSSVSVGRALIQGGTLNGVGGNDGIHVDISEDEDPASVNFGGVVIDGNYIDGWTHGIYLVTGTRTSIVGNIIQNNQDGVYIQNSNRNYILGNNILNNGGGPSGVHVNHGVGNQAHFNKILNNGTGVFSGLTMIDAELNWWGDTTGPLDPGG